MKYRLKFATLAIEVKDGRPSTVVIPMGAVLNHLDKEGGLVRLEWEGRDVILLLHDLQERGEGVRDAGNTAAERSEA